MEHMFSTWSSTDIPVRVNLTHPLTYRREAIYVPSSRYVPLMFLQVNLRLTSRLRRST